MGAVVTGQGAGADLDALDDVVFATMVGAAVADPQSRVHGRAPEEVIAATDGGRGPERMLDFLVRTGPYGDGFGADPDGLTLARLRDAPHGIDLGPLESRLPDDLLTPTGKVELAPEPLLEDVARLGRAAQRTANGGFVLVGRRHVRSNNSWMHNIDVLMKGKERCTLQISTADAARIGVVAGGSAKVSSSSGMVVAPVEVTDDIMPGVVSLPHGWGHDLDGTEMAVAAARPGVNSNRLTPGDIDPLSGNAVLNGIPVEVVPA
jgi:anaerobic selenocysteine-containing dehydrogenase